MKQKVVLCPGQGAQAVGMGKAWFDSSPEAREVFEAADRVMSDFWRASPATAGMPKLSKICFEGPADLLNRTDVSQPAIYTVGGAMFASAQKVWHDDWESPMASAGLSLGEYTALCAAGAIGFEEGLRLVALRGRAMQEAAEAVPSGMVALIGADEASAQGVCDAASGGEVLVCANFNAPGQVVISGSRGACERSLGAAEAAGLRATPLVVAGAFHSPIMAPAAERLGEALAAAAITEPRCPVLSNVTGQPHAAGGGGSMVDAIRQRLVEQLTSPVRWSECCQWLVANAAGDFVEVAPGKTLSGLMRRIDRATKVQSYDEPIAG
ncbi:MAG: ACP S-malonyltransferase [Phycisphaerales bacterium]|nr:ACP S-malonyltransferase [Phycisphaerales bacterium]